MKITEKLWGDPGCPNGVTCEGTWATDAGGKLRRLKRTRVLSTDELANLNMHCEPDEFVVFVPDEHC